MSSILERPPPPFDKRVSYGTSPQQFAELRFPQGQGPFPLLFVVHGGFWQSIYDLSHIGHLCATLTEKGIVTCSVEYRRLGDPGGGWPGTFQDVSLATNQIAENISSDPRVDSARTGILGHSAGGHLALWLTGKHHIPETSPLSNRVTHPLVGAVSLAGVCDLRTAWKQKLGNGAVTRLIGGSPTECPDRYRTASPIELLPTGKGQVLVHGTSDNIVPFSQSEKFVEKAQRLGDHPTLVKLRKIGHFELINPESDAWPAVERAILPLLGLG